MTVIMTGQETATVTSVVTATKVVTVTHVATATVPSTTVPETLVGPWSSVNLAGNPLTHRNWR